MLKGQIITLQTARDNRLATTYGVYGEPTPGGLILVRPKVGPQILVVPWAIHSVETRRNRQEHFRILKELHQEVVRSRIILPYGLYQRLCQAVQVRSIEVIQHPE